MGLGTIMLIVCILFLIGAIPSWLSSKGLGFSGSLGLAVFALPLLLLTGRL